MMREKLLSRYPELAPLALSTISRSLRNDMQYTYRKASIRAPQSFSSMNKIHLLEAIKIQKFLDRSNVVIVYVDETSISEVMYKPYSWGLRGATIYKEAQARNKSHSLIMAVTKGEVIYHELMSNSIKSIDFIRFLRICNMEIKNHPEYSNR